MRFSARVTSFRNIRFNWHGTYGKSLWFFVIAPIVSILSLGIFDATDLESILYLFC